MDILHNSLIKNTDNNIVCIELKNVYNNEDDQLNVDYSNLLSSYKKLYGKRSLLQIKQKVSSSASGDSNELFIKKFQTVCNANKIQWSPPKIRDPCRNEKMLISEVYIKSIAYFVINMFKILKDVREKHHIIRYMTIHHILLDHGEGEFDFEPYMDEMTNLLTPIISYLTENI